MKHALAFTSCMAEALAPRLLVTLCSLVAIFLSGCNYTKKQKYDNNDLTYLKFGFVIPVKQQEVINFYNPHEVAASAVFRCSRGETLPLLEKMQHVESDKELGRSFVTFLEDAGPELERFAGKDIFLKFQAYKLNKDTSVWYYYITDAFGKNLSHSPWVSLHRSRSTGRCALTGIFLYDPNTGEPGEIPKDTIKEL